MSAQNPVSPKVIASAAGAGAGATVSSLVVWVLGVTFWGAPTSAQAADQAIAAVPGPVSGIVVLAVTVVSSALFGWRVSDPHRVTTAELLALQGRDARPSATHGGGAGR